MTKASTRPRGGEQAPLRDRARSFAFEGLPEKDRFGIFDPALRASFGLGVLFAGVFGTGAVFESMGSTGASWSVSVVLLALVAVGGAVCYRRIWRKPAERELLLRMAREDDESRALRAKMAKERAATEPNDQ